MNMEEIESEINKLDTSERLILVERIWNTLAVEKGQMPLSEWQKNELNTRYSDYQNQMVSLHSAEEVHTQLNKKHV